MTEMRIPTIQEIILLHDAVADKYPRVRRVVMSKHKLLDITHKPFATFAGQPLYAGIFEQAACLLEGIVRLHPFEDGNKRTALLAAEHFLNINGREMAIPDDAPDILVEIAARRADSEGEVRGLTAEVAGWLERGVQATR